MTEASELGRLIWETSRADEGTISVTGADIIADKLRKAGYVKLVLDDATVERAARALYEADPLALYDEDAERFVEGGRPWEWLTEEYKRHQRKLARAVLAAAVKEER